MNLMLEVEDVPCPVDDMKVAELGKGEQGRVEDADGASLWGPPSSRVPDITAYLCLSNNGDVNVLPV